MRPDRFTSDVPKKSVEERLADFDGYLVAHPTLEHTTDQVMLALRRPKSLTLVIGPSGVGKTTLRRKIEQLMLKKYLSHMEENPGLRSIGSFEARAPEGGNFNWPRHYHRPLLEALGEPQVHRKLVQSARWRGIAFKDIWIPRHSLDWGDVIERTLKLYGVTAVMVDEGQHIGKITSGRKLQDQMDVIKSMIERTEIPHVLLGTYELLPLMSLSAQLIRRSMYIPFTRYRANVKQDRHQLTSAVWSLFHGAPVEEAPDVDEQHVDLIFEICLGCFGIFKDCTRRALAVALDEDERGRLTWEHIKAQALPAAQLERIARDIIAGEEQLADDPGARDRLRALLELDGQPRAGAASTQNARPTSRPRSRVGHRNPVRDSVRASHAG